MRSTASPSTCNKFATFLILLIITITSGYGTAETDCRFAKYTFGHTFSVAQSSKLAINRRWVTSNETECANSCCLSSGNCSLYIYGNSSLMNDSNCFLLSCQYVNISLCMDELQHGNKSNGAIFVGLKDTVNNTKTFISTSSKQLNHSSIISEHLLTNNTTPNISHAIISNSLTVVPHRISSNRTTKTNHTLKNSQSKLVNSSINNLNTTSNSQIHYYTPLLNNSNDNTTSTLSNGSQHIIQLSNQNAITNISDAPQNQALLSTIHRPQGTMQSQFINHYHHSSIANHTSSDIGSLTMGNVLVLGSLKTSTHGNIPVSSQVQKDVHKSQTHHNSSTTPKPKKKLSEGHNHTTPASLVIALMIGVLFFCAVVFLIGRRWLETCCRRSYSHVDYLLNDYDD